MQLVWLKGASDEEEERGQTRVPRRRSLASQTSTQTENINQPSAERRDGGGRRHLPLGAPQHASVRQGEIGENRPAVRHATTNTPPSRGLGSSAEDTGGRQTPERVSQQTSERASEHRRAASLSPLSTPPPSLISW